MALTQVAGGMLAGSITSSQISSVAGSTITGSQSIPKSTLPSGSIIQMVEASRTSVLSFTTTYSTYTSFISGSITTTVPNSKVLVMCNVPVYVSGNGSAWSIAQYYQLLQGGSLLQQFEHNGPQSGTEQASTWEFQYLTGAQSVGTYTFSMQGSIVGGSATVYICRTVGGNSTKLSLLMMEIAP